VSGTDNDFGRYAKSDSKLFEVSYGDVNIGGSMKENEVEDMDDADDMQEMKEKVAKRKMTNKKMKMLGKADNKEYSKGKAT